MSSFQRFTKKLTSLLFAGLFFTLFSVQAESHAGVMLPFPDLDGSVNGYFVPSTGQLLLGNGVSRILTGPGTEIAIRSNANSSSAAMFRLDAVFDSNGNLQSGGTFSVKGWFDGADGGPSNDIVVPLVTGTLQQTNRSLFQAADSGGIRFSASVDGGQLSSVFGDEVLIQFGQISLDLTASMSLISGVSMNMGRPVPEPSTATVWLGLTSCLLVRRRRR